MSLEGLWYGPTAACALNFIFYEIKMRSSDWQEIADNLIAKMNEEKKEMNDKIQDEDDDVF